MIVATKAEKAGLPASSNLVVRAPLFPHNPPDGEKAEQRVDGASDLPTYGPTLYLMLKRVPVAELPQIARNTSPLSIGEPCMVSQLHSQVDTLVRLGHPYSLP